MKVLVVAEHDHQKLRPAARSALRFARDLTGDTGQIEVLVLGRGIERVVEDARCYGNVLYADHEQLTDPLAERYAPIIAETARQHEADVVAAASTSWSKDIMGRAGGLLGGAMASEVSGHALVDGAVHLQRPMFAGAFNATVVLHGHPMIITIRGSAYAPAEPADEPGEARATDVDVGALPAATS